LIRAVAHRYPELANPEQAIRSGHVLVNGWPSRNPETQVDVQATISLSLPRSLRGEVKLQAALKAFRAATVGRVALDVGAAAGGFTRALLDAGAKRVYAVDAGFGQLLGSLRQDPRVVNLEATNLAALGPALVPETIELVTIDVSYLSLARAIPQLAPVPLAADAQLIALVKPMFELGLPAPPPDGDLPAALAHAIAGIQAAGWTVHATMQSPIPGARGAVELFVYARRRSA
jgi:23S rRNA (cytidine1920-2'-O)/16S rRNA (cytidine1409-2'-O)-methyltransferase